MLPLSALRSMRPMIATPCGFGGKPPYIASLFQFSAHTAKLGFDCRLELIGESLITRARTRLLAKFLESECTHFLFWDADVGASTEAVLRLLLADRDVAVGVYPLKHYNADGSLSYPFSAVGGRLIADQDGFGEVTEATTGLMCVKREVFEKLTEAYPDLNYIPENEPERAPSHWLFFDTMIDKTTKRFLSEDYAFCKRWRDIGGKVYIDINSKLDHQGEHVFHGDLVAHLSGCPSRPHVSNARPVSA